MISIDRLKEMALEDIENNPERHLEETAELLQQLDQLKKENKELKEKVNSYICSTNCYKHKENDKYRQALQEIKEIAEDECKNCTVKLLLEDEINCKRCYKTKILQKCEVLNEV